MMSDGREHPMAVKATKQQEPLRRIVRNPRILGQTVVIGTRVPVRAIVLQHRIRPETVDILHAFPMLSADDIDDALRFYREHSAEIDLYIGENDPDDA